MVFLLIVYYIFTNSGLIFCTSKSIFYKLRSIISDSSARTRLDHFTLMPVPLAIIMGHTLVFIFIKTIAMRYISSQPYNYVDYKSFYSCLNRKSAMSDKVKLPAALENHVHLIVIWGNDCLLILIRPKRYCYTLMIILNDFYLLTTWMMLTSEREQFITHS